MSPTPAMQTTHPLMDTSRNEAGTPTRHRKKSPTLTQLLPPLHEHIMNPVSSSETNVAKILTSLSSPPSCFGLGCRPKTTPPPPLPIPPLRLLFPLPLSSHTLVRRPQSCHRSLTLTCPPTPQMQLPASFIVAQPTAFVPLARALSFRCGQNRQS